MKLNHGIIMHVSYNCPKPHLSHTGANHSHRELDDLLQRKTSLTIRDLQDITASIISDIAFFKLQLDQLRETKNVDGITNCVKLIAEDEFLLDVIKSITKVKLEELENSMKETKL